MPRPERVVSSYPLASVTKSTRMGRFEASNPKVTPQILGKRIRNRRKSLGLTQSQAAGLCGVGERFLREIERGKDTAEIGKVLHVLRGLGLRLQLVGEDGE